jgi:Na+/H+ antiporter NhaB
VNASKTLGGVLTTVGAVLVTIAAVWGYVGDYVSQFAIWLPVLAAGIVLLLIGILVLRRRRPARVES